MSDLYTEALERARKKLLICNEHLLKPFAWHGIPLAHRFDHEGRPCLVGRDTRFTFTVYLTDDGEQYMGTIDAKGIDDELQEEWVGFSKKSGRQALATCLAKIRRHERELARDLARVREVLGDFPDSAAASYRHD